MNTQKRARGARAQLDSFLDELEWPPTRKYVEVLRARGDLLPVGPVDVDVPQIVLRRFVCDAERCLQRRGEQVLVDRGCCCRYEVPVTLRDRERVLRHLPQVRENLPPDHRLQDPGADPFTVDEDFDFTMVNDNPLGGCQFNLYQEGLCRCAIHATALEHGEDPGEWKPVACSLWPMAVDRYPLDGAQRFLLTVYGQETSGLFELTDDDPFACLQDQAPSMPRLYQAERSVLTFLFGAAWYQRLDRAARRLLAARGEG